MSPHSNEAFQYLSLEPGTFVHPDIPPPLVHNYITLDSQVKMICLPKVGLNVSLLPPILTGYPKPCLLTLLPIILVGG